MVKGLAAYVLPRFENKPYVMIEAGAHFGHVDFAITDDMLNHDLAMVKRFRRKHMVRRFTVRALANCEMFILTIDELEKMKMEFPELYVELFTGAYERLQRELLLKLDTIKRMEAKMLVKSDFRSRFAALFTPVAPPQAIRSH
jgi:hypothetical protein